MAQENNLILVGIISGAHGIQGNVLIKSYTQPKDNILFLKLIDVNDSQVKIKRVKTNNAGAYICKLESCHNRTQAELLKGTQLFCMRSDFPEPEAEEYYCSDLQNMVILDNEGAKIGKVINVVNFGAGDIIEIKLNDDREFLVAFTKENFPVINKEYIMLNNLDKLI
ncbi:MAG: ribosome maturation factor RimM [Rickettsiaceae bacterium]